MYVTDTTKNRHIILNFNDILFNIFLLNEGIFDF